MSRLWKDLDSAQIMAKSQKHDKGKALSILAHKLARAVYYMLKRKVAFGMDIFLRR
jgi:hypothetical protein